MIFPGEILRFCQQCGAEYARGKSSAWEFDESFVLVTTDKDGTTHENPPGIDVHIHADGTRHPVVSLTDYNYREDFGRDPHHVKKKKKEGATND